MENTVKKTKADYFAELREVILENVTDQAAQNEYLDFIDKQLETLEKRKVAAAARAEKKRAESDALTEEIFGLLGTDLMTVDDIVVALDSEEVTRNKVTARLSKLFNAGKIEKESVKTDNGKRMAYRLSDAE